LCLKGRFGKLFALLRSQSLLLFNLLPLEEVSIPVDILDEILTVLYCNLRLARVCQVPDERGEGVPLRGRHVNMGLVRNHLLVEIIRIDRVVSSQSQQAHVGLFKLLAKLLHLLFWILEKKLHLSNVLLAIDVVFKAVLVTALLLTHLAIEPQLLKTSKLLRRSIIMQRRAHCV